MLPVTSNSMCVNIDNIHANTKQILTSVSHKKIYSKNLKKNNFTAFSGRFFKRCFTFSILIHNFSCYLFGVLHVCKIVGQKMKCL